MSEIITAATAVLPDGPDDEPAAEPEATPEPAAAPPPLRRLMARYDGPRDLDGQLRLAAALAKARKAIPWQYRDNAGDILAVIGHARALDVAVATAMDNIHFNDRGQAGMRARLMHALVLRAGHTIQVLQADDVLVRMAMMRCDGKPGGRASWSILEASAAGLIKPDSGWRSYPADMLWARCVSRLCRRYAPDVTSGMYEIGELDDGVPHDDALDPVDMSTAMRDLDGNLVPAPDVVELLEDLDSLNAQQIQQRWTQAGEEGILREYAGTVDQAHLSVQEVLENALAHAQTRERRERAQTRRTKAVPGVTPQNLTDADQPAHAPAVPAQPAPAEDQPAGRGANLRCGCAPGEVARSGEHRKGCKRD